jgi:CRP/FNR family transcriptional regulator, cyclic AMP receptor protein
MGHDPVEHRLRHALLRLAHIEDQDGQVGIVSNVNQEMLAQLVGTTRPRANYFLNKLRRLGLIDYGRRLGAGVIEVRGCFLRGEIND